jgi:hypothetical protein
VTDTSTKRTGGLNDYLRQNWVSIYFRVAILLLVFSYGIAVGIYKLFPYDLIQNGVSAAKDWNANAEHYARIRPQKHLRPSRAVGSGVVQHNPQKALNGITLLSGMWGETLAIKLVNMDGDLLHEWPVSFNAIWPEAKHLTRQPHDWDTNIHGMVAQPNGDIIFNFEHDGLVSINACAEVNWKLDELTHHVVFRAEDENLWVAGARKHATRDKRFALLSAPYIEEILIELSPAGEVLREISLLEVFYNSNYEGLLLDPADVWGNQGTWRGTVGTSREDITHLNDIEILSSDMAGAFEQFNAGDILLSIRNLDLLIIIDGKTELIKWTMTGPWLMQHDPDFLASGKIMVFDNQIFRRGEMRDRGSRILEVDPISHEVDVIYMGNPDERFFSSQMGKQQPLINGNILIAEPDGGRAFEVDRNGEIVWEFINRWSEEQVAVITQATRLPADYFDFSATECQ